MVAHTQISALRKLKQDDCKLEANVDYTVEFATNPEYRRP